MAINWIFDPEPPSRKRTGGSAAEYSFEGRIDILVRETIQNSLDAQRGSDRPVEVEFQIIKLTGDPLISFLEAIDWVSLEDNLDAVPQNRGGRAIAETKRRLEEEDELRLLVIKDTGTRGLEGSEHRQTDTERNPFSALVRDELYSDKPGESAGGSFGLGKSLLWAYSGFKTVLFASVPADPPVGKSGVRFIGRTSLPWHETAADGACSGDGWLGVAHEPDNLRRRAESIWGPEAAHIADECLCPRHPIRPGLSIVVVGFSEPGEEDRSPQDLAIEINQAAVHSFWPAMVDGNLTVRVEVNENGEAIHSGIADPDKDPGFRMLGDLLRNFRNGTLEERTSLDSGDSALAWIPLELPRRVVQPAHGETDARAAILVRLLDQGAEADEVKDRIFRFRGLGMVVRREQRANLSLIARPYTAAVLVGLAAGDSESDIRAEHFLRAAEPPAHDEWTSNTRRLKQEYVVHGCKAKLARFEKQIRTAITKLIAVPEERGGQLPKAILQHLRFAGSGGGGNLRFLSLTPEAQVVNGAWRFQVGCRRIRRDDAPWQVRVRLKYARDGGGGDDIHAISQVQSERATRTSIINGDAFIEFPPNVDRAIITGTTDPDLLPQIGTRASIRLCVDGKAGSIQNA